MGNAQKQKAEEETATVTSHLLHEGIVFDLRSDLLTFPTQPPHAWEIIVTRGAVALLPILENGDLLLIKQWRRAIQKIIYELPAGTLEKGEAIETCAQRELREETGYEATTLIPFGGLYSTPGFCTEYIHLFLAKGLTEKPLKGDSNEGIDTIAMPLEQALALIDSGEIDDAKTTSTILRYQRHLYA